MLLVKRLIREKGYGPKHPGRVQEAILLERSGPLGLYQASEDSNCSEYVCD